ncbi:MAG: hypothetical protein ACTHMY_19775 [Solirubrobacteraceae bacterium]
MRWRIATIVLIAASVAVGAWVAVRDRGNPPWHPAQLAQAEQDAHQVLTSIELTSYCARGCSETVVDNTAPDTWRFRLRVGVSRRCYLIRLDAFSSSTDDLHSLPRVPCTG